MGARMNTKAIEGHSSEPWNEVVRAEVGHVFYDAINEGVRIVVMRGPSHLCAYLGVPEAHPLAGFGYDDIPLDCHGGLTFGKAGDSLLAKGWFWYGWDYGHSGDYCTYYDKEPLSKRPRDEKKWTVEEVTQEAIFACYDFRRLMKLAEKCSLKESGFQIARKQS